MRTFKAIRFTDKNHLLSRSNIEETAAKFCIMILNFTAVNGITFLFLRFISDFQSVERFWRNLVWVILVINQLDAQNFIL